MHRFFPLFFYNCIVFDSVMVMNIDEFKVEQICESYKDEIMALVRRAYMEGYDNGVNHSREIVVGGTRFYDLGLPSGTLWSAPVTVQHPYTYVKYDLKSYDSASDLGLPTLEDFHELMENCSVVIAKKTVSEDVVIIGPSGARLSIGTKDYLNNGGNPYSHVCNRQGEQVEPMTNQFWLKSDCVDNEAKTGLVDFCNESISLSSHFTGYKLPYLLVKKSLK